MYNHKPINVKKMNWILLQSPTEEMIRRYEESEPSLINWVVIPMIIVIILAILYYIWTRNTEQGSMSYLYWCMRDHGPDHPFTRSALEEATEKKMKRDGYPDPFVKAFHTMGGKWEGEVSWGHTATNDFNVCKITIQTDGYNVSYQIGESKF